MKIRVDSKDLSDWIGIALYLLTQAREADPSKNIMGKDWHEKYDKAVDLFKEMTKAS